MDHGKNVCFYSEGSEQTSVIIGLNHLTVENISGRQEWKKRNQLGKYFCWGRNDGVDHRVRW